MKNKEAMVMLTAKIPKRLLIQARVEAAKLNKSRSQLIREAIEKFLAEGVKQQ